MKINEIIKNLDLFFSTDEMKLIKKETDCFVKILEKNIRKEKTDADVFVGGSYGKGTLVKADKIDIDIFARFNCKYEDISKLLEKILIRVEKEIGLRRTKIHGSRDYFRFEKNNLLFEVIPVARIKKPSEAKNVTDLSYFHVNYVKRNASKKVKREIIVGKQFCKAQGVYGAESYIHGFSGYGLECLMIRCKTFEKMLRLLNKTRGQLVLDPKKHYKNAKEAILFLNESKARSPIILIDPTWKERNVFAALSGETFGIFLVKTKKFLAHPSERYFEIQHFNEGKMKERAEKKNAEFLNVEIETDRQEGDIAGTKMKKFAGFLEANLSKFFEIMEKNFSYGEGNKSNAYFVVSARKEIIKVGPPVKDDKNAQRFRDKNKVVFAKNARLYASVKVNWTAKEFLSKLKDKYGEQIRGMSITGMRIIDD